MISTRSRSSRSCSSCAAAPRLVNRLADELVGHRLRVVLHERGVEVRTFERDFRLEDVGRRPPHLVDGEPGLLEHRHDAFLGEESDVRVIEEAERRVLEATLKQSEPNRSVSDVGIDATMYTLGASIGLTFFNVASGSRRCSRTSPNTSASKLCGSNRDARSNVSRSPTMSSSHTSFAADAASRPISTPTTVHPRSTSTRLM